MIEKLCNDDRANGNDAKLSLAAKAMRRKKEFIETLRRKAKLLLKGLDDLEAAIERDDAATTDELQKRFCK